MAATQDTFKKGDISITVYNSSADVLTEAEITTPNGTLRLKPAQKLKWEIIASWLRGEPTNTPRPTNFTDSERRKVADWAGPGTLAGGPVYWAGLKMIGEECGWVITSGRSVDEDESKDGPEPAVAWSQGFLDRETALEALKNITVETHDDGTKAPYQYLVLLWAISAALRGVAQPVPYSVAKPQIAPILNRFAIAKSPPRLENPWFALRQTPWWTIPNPVSRYKDVPSSDMSAGLDPQIIRLLEEDGIFAARAVAAIESILSDIVGESHEIDRLLAELALQDLKPSRLIPVESNVAESFTVETPEVSEEERRRKEADLQNAYKSHLERLGHQVTAVEIFDDGQTLRVDLFDVDEADLIEAKASARREAVRLGLGQILDYARYVNHRRRTLLLPEKPSTSLVRLLSDHDVRVVHRTPDGDFVESWLAERLF